MKPTPHPPRPGLAATLAAGALAACAPAPLVGPEQPGGVQASGLSDIQERIFTSRCATSACHSGNPPANAPLSLDPGLAWSQLVGVPSVQLPSMNLVEPGDPERSYLVLKLRGTAGAAGGTGTLMPLGDAPLDAEEQASVEAWIADGAPNG